MLSKTRIALTALAFSTIGIIAFLLYWYSPEQAGIRQATEARVQAEMTYLFDTIAITQHASGASYTFCEVESFLPETKGCIEGLADEFGFLGQVNPEKKFNVGDKTVFRKVMKGQTP